MADDLFRKPKIEIVDRRQLLLRTVDVEQLVPEDDPVRAIWELTGQLDLNRFYVAIASEEGGAGREAIDPRLLISLWVYAYSQGIGSAREVSRLMAYHPGYQWLSGMREINHHTLSDFRVNHQEALDALFTQILGILSSEGLVTLERVMQDGTKIRANAGVDSLGSEKRLRKHLRLAGEQVEAMGDPRSTQEVTPRLKAARERAAHEKQERLKHALQELEHLQECLPQKRSPEEMRVSMSDPDSRVMKHGGGGGYSLSYNVQFSTDAKAGAVVDCAVSQSPVDASQLPQAVGRIQSRLGEKPAQMVADAEYTTNKTILTMQDIGVDFIGSPRSSLGTRAATLKRRGIDPAFHPEAFVYRKASDTYRCPSGNVLRRTHDHVSHFHQEVYYQARDSDCARCPYKGKCSPRQMSRVICRSEPFPEIVAFRKRMQTRAAQAVYRQRAPVAEFTNAWIKDKFKFRKFKLRGLIKAGLEVLWASLTMNIQLWIRRVWRPAWSIQAS